MLTGQVTSEQALRSSGTSPLEVKSITDDRTLQCMLLQFELLQATLVKKQKRQTEDNEDIEARIGI